MKLNSQHLRLRTTRVQLVVCLAIFLCNGICAFQLSMIASSPFRQYDGSSTSRNQNSLSQRVQPSSSSTSVTSGLISNMAVMALKLRLEGQTHVSCDVTASSSNVLLRGQVGPVTVRGRGWQSLLGLTCRAIDATVDSCQLDMGRILSNQKLVLTVPAEGQAMVALNAADFGNFITHPLMRPPGLPEVSDEIDASSSKLEFLKEGVAIDPSSAAVSFFGTYLDAKWKFSLQRGTNGQKALVTVRPEQVPQDAGLDYISLASSLTEATSKFFNEMVFELDGTSLTFLDMMVTDKGKEPSAMLSLKIKVKKFPSAGLKF